MNSTFAHRVRRAKVQFTVCSNVMFYVRTQCKLHVRTWSFTCARTVLHANVEFYVRT